MRSVTSQINHIRRVLKPISLLSHEVVVEKIDIEIPDIYECASRILKDQMYSEAWQRLIEGLIIQNEARNTVVTFTSYMGLSTFNCTIANVRSKYEKTLKSQVLYTNDEDFNLKNMKVIRNQKEFDNIENGITNFINPSKTYVIKTKTREEYSGVPEVVTDIVFYIPESDLFNIN
jgi:hypothetical protein